LWNEFPSVCKLPCFPLSGIYIINGVRGEGGGRYKAALGGGVKEAEKLIFYIEKNVFCI